MTAPYRTRVAQLCRLIFTELMLSIWGNWCFFFYIHITICYVTEVMWIYIGICFHFIYRWLASVVAGESLKMWLSFQGPQSRRKENGSCISTAFKMLGVCLRSFKVDINHWDSPVSTLTANNFCLQITLWLLFFKIIKHLLMDRLDKWSEGDFEYVWECVKCDF